MYNNYSFHLEREATIQFNDVFGTIPLLPLGVDVLGVSDFDAILTAQVRNSGFWMDGKFGIGSWPALGEYGIILINQLREHQMEEAIKSGITFGGIKGNQIKYSGDNHPDTKKLAESLMKVIVVVVNCAPRNSGHHSTGKNGEEFYAGLTDNNLEIYAQLDFFRGLHARKKLKALFRVPNEAGVWPAGEQFRSSVVSQVRRTPKKLVPVETLDIIPKIKQEGRLAYVDRFCNVRVEIAANQKINQKLQIGKKITLGIADGSKMYTIKHVHVVKRIIDIPENELGIYYNPADPSVQNGPTYVEIVRRVSNPNSDYMNAYMTLCNAIKQYEHTIVMPTEWDKINITIKP